MLPRGRGACCPGVTCYHDLESPGFTLLPPCAQVQYRYAVDPGTGQIQDLVQQERDTPPRFKYVRLTGEGHTEVAQPGLRGMQQRLQQPHAAAYPGAASVGAWSGDPGGLGGSGDPREQGGDAGPGAGLIVGRRKRRTAEAAGVEGGGSAAEDPDPLFGQLASILDLDLDLDVDLDPDGSAAPLDPDPGRRGPSAARSATAAGAASSSCVNHVHHVTGGPLWCGAVGLKVHTGVGFRGAHRFWV